MIWAKYKNSEIYTFVLDVRSSSKVMVLFTPIPSQMPAPYYLWNLIFLIWIDHVIAVQRLKPSWEVISGWMCRWTSFSSEKHGQCWPCSLFSFTSTVLLLPIKWNNIYSFFLVIKEVTECNRIKVILFWFNKVVIFREHCCFCTIIINKCRCIYFLLWQQQKWDCGNKRRFCIYS